jgi:Zn-dependent metalloprotease
MHQRFQSGTEAITRVRKQEEEMLDLRKANVRWDRENYVPKKVSGFLSRPLAGTPRRIAGSFLKQSGAALKITALAGDLRYEKTAESLGARAALFQQYYRRIPIHGAWVVVHIDKRNRVFLVKNDTVPVDRLEEKLAGTKRRFLGADKIDAIISKRAKAHGTLSTRVSKERMIYPRRGNLLRVWKVKFGTRNPAGSWVLFIDRITGHIVEELDVLRKTIGRGAIFSPNPVVTLDRDDLSDRADRTQSILRPAYRTVTLNGLKPGGYLQGPYADTTNTRRCARSATGDFLYTRDDDRFEEVMAYYHIDTVQRYIQSLGFVGKRGILARPIKVDVHGTQDDNSYYDPSPDQQDLTFGNGGVDDAEDAEVILHEYGHAIQDSIIPGFGQGHEGGSMGEGFGDYWAGSFFERVKPAKRKPRIAEWDMKGIKRGPSWLRRLDGTKRYPEDMANEVHDDGEIWSACLWRVRKLLGRKKADTVILESHFYLGQYADFKDGAEAIIMAEKNLYGGKRAKGLTKIFKQRGIL